jgi:hypothetical protein
MHTGDRRRTHPAPLWVRILVVVLVITGVVIQYTVNARLGQTLLGGAVVTAVLFTAGTIVRPR